MTKRQAHRYHDISCGHRVVGHESKCRHLHGHNYRVHFYCESDQLDEVGRVIDFSVIKSNLCMWLEENWDHKFLCWVKDYLMQSIAIRDPYKEHLVERDEDDFYNSFASVPFNPTAENMAEYLLVEIGPKQLQGTGVTLTKVVIEETRKCAVTMEI